jgi:hypothetical protein
VSIYHLRDTEVEIKARWRALWIITYFTADATQPASVINVPVQFEDPPVHGDPATASVSCPAMSGPYYFQAQTPVDCHQQ